MNSRRRCHLRRAIDVYFSLGAVAQDGRIAQKQRVACDASVLFAVALDLQAQIGAHGFERPADVVAVQKARDAIEIFLAESTLGTNKFVARDTARGNQHDEDAIVGQEQKAQVLDHAARQRRRNKNAQPARNSRKHVARALHHGFGSLRGIQLAANPLAIFGAGRSLRRYLLDEKAIGRSRGHATGGSVRLVEIALVFEIGHHVANRRGTQRLDVAARNAARRNGFARFDVCADHVGQDLLMALLL